jgi:hypothetical protein
MTTTSWNACRWRTSRAVCVMLGGIPVRHRQLVFVGLSCQGNPVRLIQHLSQLNFLMCLFPAGRRLHKDGFHEPQRGSVSQESDRRFGVTLKTCFVIQKFDGSTYDKRTGKPSLQQSSEQEPSPLSGRGPRNPANCREDRRRASISRCDVCGSIIRQPKRVP